MPAVTSGDFLREARSWIGTRYVHQGRVKRNEHNLGGCDCLGLLIGVVRELRMLSDVVDAQGERIPLYLFDHAVYGERPNGSLFKQKITEHLKEVPKDALSIGDIALFLIQDNPQHVALIADGPHSLHMLHCHGRSGRVAEHTLDESWRAKIDAVYRFKPCHWETY
jgi:hypothetical protein